MSQRKFGRRIKPTVALAALMLGSPAALGNLADDQQSIAELVDSLETIRERHGVAAMGFALVHRDRMLHVGNYGIADRASGRPVNPETRFRIGSITKAFTGLAFLRLAERGKLPLNTRVDAFLDPPPYENPFAATSRITIDQLLEHTAGFRDLTKAEFDFNDPGNLPLKLTLQSNAGRKVHWQPGYHASYTNVGAGIAGHVAELAIGESYETIMETEVFQPLGTTTATLVLDADTKNHLATGYDSDGVTPIPYWHMVFRPFGAINIHPSDMGRFIRMLLNDGVLDGKRYLQPGAIRRMEQPRTTLAARQGLDYGYGLGNYQWYRSGFLFHGHGGDGDGYLAHFGYQTDTGLGYFVVITAFKHRPLRQMRGAIERAIVNGQASPPKQSPVTMSDDEIQRVVGRYEAVTSRFPPRRRKQLEIFQREERLFTRVNTEGARPLIPVGDGLFRRPDQASATVAILGREGDIIYQGDAGNFLRVGPLTGTVSQLPKPPKGR